MSVIASDVVMSGERKISLENYYAGCKSLPIGTNENIIIQEGASRGCKAERAKVFTLANTLFTLANTLSGKVKQVRVILWINEHMSESNFCQMGG
jgi:hypothetical protein